MKLRKDMFVSAAGALTLGTLLIGSVAFAQTTPPQGGAQGGMGWGGRGGHMMGRGGIFGTVASISGTTLTVTAKVPVRQGQDGQTSGATQGSTTYTVDASSATVDKNGSTSSVSAIAVGDTVMVQGTVNGTSVTAKVIHDGVPAKGTGPRGTGMKPDQSLGLQGNGQPVIGGSVSAVSGNTLTVTTSQGNIAYTVDASSATVKKGNATSTVASIAVGDHVVVQGAINGTSVTATTVVDTGAAAQGSGSAGAPAPRGVMGMLQSFFRRLFGF
jgi:hypothetical protein